MKLFNEVNWYGRAMGRYATFSGRSTRAEFWYFTLVSGLMSLGATLLDDGMRTGGICYLLVALVHAIPSLSVFVRRMHDTDRTGWWFLAVFTGVGAIPIFVFLCSRGTPAANRFGEPFSPAVVPAPGEAPRIVINGSTHARDSIGEVERLAELRAKGAITDAEFDRMKAAVIADRSAVGGEARS